MSLRQLIRRFGRLGLAAWLVGSAAMFGAYWPAFRALPAVYRAAEASPQLKAASDRLAAVIVRAVWR